MKQESDSKSHPSSHHQDVMEVDCQKSHQDPINNNIDLSSNESKASNDDMNIEGIQKNSHESNEKSNKKHSTNKNINNLIGYNGINPVHN